MRSLLRLNSLWFCATPIAVIMAPSVGFAQTIQNNTECAFGRLDNRRNCQFSMTYSTKASDLKITAKAGVIVANSPGSGAQVVAPVRSSVEWSNKQTTITGEVGADIANSSVYPAAAIEVKQKAGDTDIIAAVKTELNSNNADTVSEGLRQTTAKAEVRQKLSKASSAYARYEREFYSDGNQVGQINIGYSRRVAAATELRLNVLNRKANRYNANYWSPVDGVTQASVEVRQGIKISKSTVAQVGLRAGAQIKGGGGGISPLIGGGAAIRQKLSDKWSLDIYGVAGYGFKAGITLQGTL